MLYFYDLIHSLFIIITDCRNRTLDDASLESKVDDTVKSSPETLLKSSEKSSKDDAPDQSSVTTDLSSIVDDQNIAEITGDVQSNSVILHVENSQNEKETLELEQNPSNATKDVNCSMKDGKLMIPTEVVPETGIDSTVTITIEEEGSGE